MAPGGYIQSDNADSPASGPIHQSNSRLLAVALPAHAQPQQNGFLAQFGRRCVYI